VEERTDGRDSNLQKVLLQAGHQWLMPVILAIQKAEIRRITVGSQPRQIVHETLSQKKKKKKNPKKRPVGVAQGVDPEFKPQYRPKKKKKNPKKRPVGVAQGVAPEFKPQYRQKKKKKKEKEA
jgi:hypothetical protein